jgi:hypothetical protein
MASFTKNTPGAPTSGQYAIGDVVTDSVGVEWHAIQAGFPYEPHMHFIPVYSVSGTPAPTSEVTAGPVTITPAVVLTGIYVRDCAGASRTDTLPTASLLQAAMTDPKVGQILTLKVVNGSDPITEILTVAAGVGGAFDAAQTAVSQIVGGGASKELKIRITDVDTPAYVVYA